MKYLRGYAAKFPAALGASVCVSTLLRAHPAETCNRDRLIILRMVPLEQTKLSVYLTYRFERGVRFNRVMEYYQFLKPSLVLPCGNYAALIDTMSQVGPLEDHACQGFICMFTLFHSLKRLTITQRQAALAVLALYFLGTVLVVLIELIRPGLHDGV